MTRTYQQSTVLNARARLEGSREVRPIDLTACVIPVMYLVREAQKHTRPSEEAYGAIEEALELYEEMRRLTYLHRNEYITDEKAVTMMRSRADNLLIQAEYLFGIRE